MSDAHLPGTAFVIDASGNTCPLLKVVNEPRVSGPNSSTDGNLAVFDGTDGGKIKDGGPPSSGGSTLYANNIARVDPTGNDSTGVVGNLGKPFLTVQGAIDAIEAGSFTYPIIDIGNNRYEATTVTTSLPNIKFVGTADELGIANTFAVAYSKVCRNLITTANNACIEFWGCEIENLTCSGTNLRVLLENAGIVGLDGAISSPGNINICGNGQLRGVIGDVVASTNNGTIKIYNAFIDTIDSGMSNVDARYGSFIRQINSANNVNLVDSRVGSNFASGTTTYADVMFKKFIFPDSDPHIAGAGYWVAGVLTKSNG